MLNIAGYKFVVLTELEALKASLHQHSLCNGLKGTILLSAEGININLAGDVSAINEWKSYIKSDSRFADVLFHETYSESQPFRHLKVKIKKEIITLRQPCIPITEKRASCMSPLHLKQWLDENRDFTLLDTRNECEVAVGTFNGAVHLHLNHFGELPTALDGIEKDKPIVMFCTGGIRCEKAALYMETVGFKQVYQLDGGILGYFAQIGMAHYTGSCFVFDERGAVDAGSFT